MTFALPFLLLFLHSFGSVILKADEAVGSKDAFL